MRSNMEGFSLTTSAGLQTVLTVPARFRGPEDTANGGWIAGALAGTFADTLDRSHALEVTLRRSTPLDTELAVGHVANSVSLSHGGEVLAEAIPVAEDVTPPPFVPFPDAARAEAGFAGLTGDHPVPGCFVCGLRDPGDGLRIFPGPVEGTDLIAAGWRVPMTLTDEEGVIPNALIWAALDCPSGWAHAASGGPGLLGRITAQVFRRVYPNGTYSVVARASGREGRKLFGESAVYEVDGTLVAAAKATWIIPA
ncbi:hotdog fold domain-containing protein [Sphaerisporangium flaviroseum]|uniref:hotdog fold domain-containing protein n=1 Tax=Sphaerisporangium flaviroseum TaxID=509199 RepID=UPI0031E5B8BB